MSPLPWPQVATNKASHTPRRGKRNHSERWPINGKAHGGGRRAERPGTGVQVPRLPLPGHTKPRGQEWVLLANDRRRTRGRLHDDSRRDADPPTLHDMHGRWQNGAPFNRCVNAEGPLSPEQRAKILEERNLKNAVLICETDPGIQAFTAMDWQGIETIFV